ncbi:hypothetical protein J6590_069467 [Homalodisca vitripennis]|nr:hypothetical protein J6590_069467 [Homalodisca vitripennis]
MVVSYLPTSNEYKYSQLVTLPSQREIIHISITDPPRTQHPPLRYLFMLVMVVYYLPTSNKYKYSQLVTLPSHREVVLYLLR